MHKIIFELIIFRIGIFLWYVHLTSKKGRNQLLRFILFSVTVILIPSA